MDTFAKEGCVIADPFSGSGTVLLESAKRGYSCIGLDINPSAYYVCRNSMNTQVFRLISERN